ncbi:hypothetical protein PENTCL1PPCAC_17403, partial [Pristionchus entomophagus]
DGEATVTLVVEEVEEDLDGEEIPLREVEEEGEDLAGEATHRADREDPVVQAGEEIVKMLPSPNQVLFSFLFDATSSHITPLFYLARQPS